MLVFKQDINHPVMKDNFFPNHSSALSFISGDPFRTDLFSNLNQLEHMRHAEDNKLHLKLVYHRLSLKLTKHSFFEWKQESNPASESTVSGFEELTFPLE